MKQLRTSLISVRWFIYAVLAMMAAMLGTASAQVVAADDAGNYLVTANWTNGANAGFGFMPWVIATNGPNSHGNYIGTAVVPMVIASITNVSSVTYTDIFGIYANGATGTNETAAFRGFANPLGTNTFKVQWGAKGAGVTTIGGVAVHGWCGFTLRNGNATNSPDDFQTGVRFYLYFLDGASPSTLYVWDGNGVQSLPGTSFSNLGRTTITNAVQAEVTVGPDNSTYHLVVKDFVQNKTLATLNSTLIGSGTIDSVALFARETTGDQVYNHLQITVPTLVPPTIINVLPTNGSIFLPANTQLSFEVDSFNSTVASNFVSVYLNGVLQPGTIFNTSAATSQLLGTNNPVLTTNTFYNYAIIAQDANGNVVSNGFTFNTFSANNPSIEAEDYNFSAGHFIASPAPDQYANLLGTNGIDYFDTMAQTNLNDYRPDYTPGDPPLPQLLLAPNDAADEPVDHDQFFEGSATDWQLAFTDAGEWQNYTRTFPGTRFTIYARAASAAAGAFQVDELVSATATTTNQPRAALGTCKVPNTGGSKTYSGQLVPLADVFGNAVVLNLAGTNTLRCTALTVRSYNLNYLMLVPDSSTNLLKPYVSIGSPAPGAVGVPLDSKVSFAIANRQTSVNPATIKLLLNAVDITASISLSTNAAGTTATYTPPGFLAPNTSNTISVIFNDNTGTNAVTNTWSFVTVNQLLTTLTNGLAVNPSSTPGFGLSLYKIDNAAPAPGSIAAALLELNGQVTNIATTLPWPNSLSGNSVAAAYTESNTLNYDVSGLATGTFTFTNKSAFPLLSTVGSQFNYVLQALFYVQLTAGSHHLVVRSDDGFGLDTGLNPADASKLLGFFNGGRDNSVPSDIFINAPTNGFYPMSLVYFQESGGGSLEFYSVDNGSTNLVNDPGNPNAIKAFAVVGAGSANPVHINNPGHAGGTTTFNFLTQSGFTHFVEYKNTFAESNWTVLTNIPGSGATANVTDSTAAGATRFYRVRTQ